MKFQHVLCCIFLVVMMQARPTVNAQTTLVPGDILFTGYNGIPAAGVAPDTISFVVLTPITTGTIIYFTERGYQGAAWQASGGTEGTISWTTGSALTIGQEVEIAGIGASAAKVNGTPNGTVAIVSGGNVTTGLSLSNAGDQVIAFQGGAGDPTSGASTKIAGISWALSCGTTTDAGWNGAGCTYGPQSSAIPPGLTGGVNAFLAGTAGSAPNNDHGKFNCTGVPYSTVAALKTAIMNKANWVFSSSGLQVYDLPASCTLYSSCSNPSISGHPSNSAICSGGNTTFSITVSGATTYQWQVNSGAGFGNISNGGVYSNVTTTTLGITGATAGMSGYLYRCIATNGSCNSTSNQATLTISVPSITASSQTNISCVEGSTGAASINTATGGIAPYMYDWTPGTPAGDGTVSVTGLTAGGWTCTVTDNIGCTGTRSFTITQPSNIPGSNNYSLPVNNQTVTKAVNNYNYAGTTCELINAVVAAGASPVSGAVTSNVWVENSVLTVAGKPFVQRHYEITPAINPGTATATVTLFFTQAEFTNFNNHPGSILNLPAGPADAAGKANLRIGKYSGSSGTGTGLPSSYSGAATVIDPDDANIVWNAAASAWEVSFPVTGFSGFIIQTEAFTLPVNWVSFDAVKQGERVKLTWVTANEQNSLEFQIKHSTNGTDWNILDQVAAAGNSNTNQVYTYLHTNPSKGVNYYHILQKDIDGRSGFSPVKQVRFESTVTAVKISVNPVVNGQLQLVVNNGSHNILLYNSQGQLVMNRQLPAGAQTIDISNLGSGIYLLKSGQQAEKIVIR